MTVKGWADFARLRAVSDPQLSPDGRSALYTVRITDVEANRRTATTYVVPVAGGASRPWPNDSSHATEARWSPNGAWVTFASGATSRRRRARSRRGSPTT